MPELFDLQFDEACFVRGKKRVNIKETLNLLLSAVVLILYLLSYS